MSTESSTLVTDTTPIEIEVIEDIAISSPKEVPHNLTTNIVEPVIEAEPTKSEN